MSDFYANYLKVCQDAVDDDLMFKKFKHHTDYTLVLEHVSPSDGINYISEIRKTYPSLLNHINKFATNDNIGNPNVYPFKELGLNMSPTTLRYIKVLADLMNLFGRLDDINIVEIGVGYGGQCKIIEDIAEPKSYTLIDRHEALLLSEKYLKHHKAKKIILREADDSSKIHYDLCISNYAFAEIPRAYQNFYAENIIKNSDMGYMTCNIFGYGDPNEPMTKEDIMSLRQNYNILPEVPLTAVNNIVYTWGASNHSII